MVNAKERERKHNAKVLAWQVQMEARFKELVGVSDGLEHDIGVIKQTIDQMQRDRIAALKEKMDPIIIREGPSTIANYMMQAKYIQYEIYPLQQRHKLTTMRLEHEIIRRKRIENEVWFLRARISELTVKISHGNTTIDLETRPKKKTWKKLCKTIVAAKRLGKLLKKE